MTNALNIIRYIFGKFITLIFDNFTIFPNVSLGWIMVSFFVIAIMLSNIISIARNSLSLKADNTKTNGGNSDGS